MTQASISPSGHGAGGLSSYVIGFVASILLTAAAFGAVLYGHLPGQVTIVVIAFLAVVQIIVHLVCFLHMNASSAQRWNVMAFAFTVVIVAVVVVGTIWVMYNANINMMPMSSHMPHMMSD